MKNYIIPIFIPHLGCKNECVFCNQRAISGNIKPVNKEDVEKIIEEYLGYFDSNQEKHIEVAFFGGSFTGIDQEKQIEYLETVQKYIVNKQINCIRISTRPDYISEGILEILKRYNVKVIELGIQSLDEEVLIKTKRGHTKSDVINASKLINKYGFILGHQVMLGLPGSTLEKEINTVNLSISLNPKIARIYPTLVIKDTKLEEMYNESIYEPLSIEEAVNRSAIIYKLYNNADINVIRIGLHVTEDLSSDSSYVAGPMHSAFGQMVRAKITLDKIKDILDKEKYKKICIEANDKTMNEIIGVNKSNLKYITNTYKLYVKKYINKNMDYGEIEIKEIE